MLKKVFNIGVNIFLLMLLLLGALVIFSWLPMPGSYQLVTLDSRSMEPAIKKGSLIFVKPKRSYDVNQIITYRLPMPKQIVTERIIEKKIEFEKTVYATKGDAQSSPDKSVVGEKDILGKKMTAWPYVGYAVGFAKKPLGFLLLVFLIVLILFYDEITDLRSRVEQTLFGKEFPPKPHPDPRENPFGDSSYGE